MEPTYHRLLKRDIKLFLTNENSLDQINRALLMEIVADYSATALYGPRQLDRIRPFRPLMFVNTVDMTPRDLFPAVTFKLDECAASAVACMEEVQAIGAAEIPPAVDYEDVNRVVAAHQQRVADIKATLHDFLIDQELLMHTVRALLLRILGAVIPLGRHRRLVDRASRSRRRREREATAGAGRQSQPWVTESYVSCISWNMMANKELATYYKEIFFVLGSILYPPRTAADDLVAMDLSFASTSTPVPTPSPAQAHSDGAVHSTTSETND